MRHPSESVSLNGSTLADTMSKGNDDERWHTDPSGKQVGVGDLCFCSHGCGGKGGNSTGTW